MENSKTTMRWILLYIAFLALGSTMSISACDDDSDEDDTGTSGDTDSDVDTDTDTDSDADTDADSDADTDADKDTDSDSTNEDCIIDVNAGDHTFTCGGVTFLVMVDEQCTKSACGLIVDVHGGSMTAKQMRRNTELHELAPSKGYLVVHPSAPVIAGVPFWLDEHYPIILDFMEQIIEAFQVDEKRIHVTGFSQGGSVSWWFICNHNDMVASVAPVAAAGTCIGDEGLDPEISILYMNGRRDPGQNIADAESMIDEVVEKLSMKDSRVIGGDGTWEQTRWTNDNGTDLDFIWHKYAVQPPAVSIGHCLPGGTDTQGSGTLAPFNATSCVGNKISLDWGETVLQWFIEHPKP